MVLKVLNEKPETKNDFSLILEKPKGFSFYPGQYLDIKLSVKDPNGDTRAFTISSSPTEDFLMITPKKGVSPFKKFTENLKIGDTIESSHPAGTFTLDESSPAVFLAGGIGITPFRSIIKYCVDQQISTPITLVYSNSTDDFLFKEELEKWQNNLKNLSTHYIQTSKEGRLNRTYLEPIVHMYVNTIFYLAGAPSFVNDMEKILLELDVEEVNIRYDRFDGYD